MTMVSLGDGDRQGKAAQSWGPGDPGMNFMLESNEWK